MKETTSLYSSLPSFFLSLSFFAFIIHPLEREMMMDFCHNSDDDDSHCMSLTHLTIAVI
jgi:hypothetical protein